MTNSLLPVAAMLVPAEQAAASAPLRRSLPAPTAEASGAGLVVLALSAIAVFVDIEIGLAYLLAFATWLAN